MIDKIIKVILKDAEDKRIGASYSGSCGDGGADKLESQVKFYNYGRQGTIPPEWSEYEIQIDTEYQDYLKLKGKFEKR